MTTKKKSPSYSPRELLAIKAADRIVARIRIAGDWKEMEFFPMVGQSVRAKLSEMLVDMADDAACARVCLYIGGVVNGERMIANIPHNHIPEELV